MAHGKSCTESEMARSRNRGGTVTPFLASTGQEATAIPPAFIRCKAERPKAPHDHFTDAIPVVSLAGLDSGDGAARLSRLRTIATALEQWGAFQVVDHGVDAALISTMLDLSARFFALPAEEKFRFEMTAGGSGGFVHSNRIFGEDVENWREFVSFFSFPVHSRDYAMWPSRPEGWRKVVERYCDATLELASRIMEVLSECMGLEKGAFMEACLQVEQKMKVNFYPKCPQPELTLGLSRQTDPGAVTLVLQDQVGGLQLTRDGGRTWLTVRPVPGAFVVKLGDYFHVSYATHFHTDCLHKSWVHCSGQGRTDGRLFTVFLVRIRFAAAEHQVVVNSVSGRLSVDAVHYPAKQARVQPLNLAEGEKPLIHRPLTFQEMYLEKKARELGLTTTDPKSAPDQETWA
ncbi:putative inactive flavonol synthase 2 [Nymphaea thermarum]|nr:putative inactive flavonol synthase 2 [Nymphaea thermarum]